jgi:hypothetical protein
MFLGHYAVAFGAKSAAPKTSLGTLFLAAQFIDLLWPTLLLLGIERVRIEPGVLPGMPLVFEYYPYSHSLLAVLILGGVFALLYYGLRRYRRGAIVLGLALVSHWFLDLLVHLPDLPLAPGSGRFFGFGLWSSMPVSQALELSLFALGVGLYWRSTTATGRRGLWGFWTLVLFLLLIHVANLFGAAPPNVATLAWAGQAQWLVVGWGYWLDRQRVSLGA